MDKKEKTLSDYIALGIKHSVRKPAADLKKMMPDSKEYNDERAKPYASRKDLDKVVKRLGELLTAIMKGKHEPNDKELTLSQKSYNPTEAQAIAIVLGFRDQEREEFLKIAFQEYALDPKRVHLTERNRQPL